MIEQLLPSGVACAEAWPGDGGGPGLLPEELALVATATRRRRDEFAGGRACAREALRALGGPVAPVLQGTRGEPLWPAGVAGAITHCDGYRACAVARSGSWPVIAIDAEPHEPISARLLDRLARPGERRRHEALVASRPRIRWDKLLFSAKECAYKALSPAAGGRAAFAEAEIAIDPGGTFAARLPSGDSPSGGDRERLDGRWLVDGGLILTAIAVPA